MDDKRNSQRRTILRNSPDAGGLGPTQTHLYMDGSRLMAQQYDGVAKTIIDLSAIPATVPVGSITQFGGDDSSTPSGWKLCNGDHFSTTGTYADLFAVIGYNYGRTNSEGVSDASGTYFKLPDLRGRVPVNRDSSDTDFDTLGETGGTKDSTVAPHTHGLSSTNQGNGYLEAVEHSVWDIPDYTIMSKVTTASATGESGWGENNAIFGDDKGYENVGSLRYLVQYTSNSGYSRIRPSNYTDGKYYNENWTETWQERWGPTEGSHGTQMANGEGFTLVGNGTNWEYASHPHVLHTHADPDKNNTFRVQGEITNSGTGIGTTGTGGNMVPYVVVNSIIRYA